MKNLFITILIFASIVANAQEIKENDTIPSLSEIMETGFIKSAVSFIGDEYDPENAIYFTDEGKEIEIQGDTITAIRSLFEHIQSASKRELDLWRAIDAAVQLYNISPGYLQGTWQANQLKNALTKLDFTITPVNYNKPKKKKANQQPKPKKSKFTGKGKI